MTIKSAATLLLGIALIPLTGCKHKSDTPTHSAPVRVTVMAVGQGGPTGSQTYSGTVASASTTTVSFAVAGTIEELYAQEGQKVGKGQLLGKLKAGDYVNANNIAQAELAEARDAHQRLQKLHDANALPDIKWVEVEQKLKQAQNAADMSERALSETTLRAPIAGVISHKAADRGQNVAPVEPVYEIVSTDALTIDISVPETEIASYAIGQPAIVEFEGMEPLAGTVSQKSIVADPLTRSYTVKVELPPVGGKVLPGMIGSVKFEKPSQADEAPLTAVELPSQAVNLSNDNRTFVWVVKNGRAERRFVLADELVAKGVLVKSGLQPGDSVIVEGMQKVGTGSLVEPVGR